MLNQFSRTELLFGKEAMERLAQSRVAVFGVGGVGGYAVEALVRSGVGAIDLIDDDNQKDRWKIQSRRDGRAHPRYQSGLQSNHP